MRLWNALRQTLHHGVRSLSHFRRPGRAGHGLGRGSRAIGLQPPRKALTNFNTAGAPPRPHKFRCSETRATRYISDCCSEILPHCNKRITKPLLFANPPQPTNQTNNVRYRQHPHPRLPGRLHRLLHRLVPVRYQVSCLPPILSHAAVAASGVSSHPTIQLSSSREC